MYSHLLLSDSSFVRTITLNRPEKRNALNAEVVREMQHAVEAAASDEDVRVLVLTGSGTAFCAGADLAYLQMINRNSPLENAADSNSLMQLLYAIRTFPKPTIAKVHGPALAGGCGLALTCDIIVADEEAKFGFTEVRIGFVPAIVMKLVVERTGMGNARELLLRGNIINPDTAQEIGLINYLVDTEELDDSVDKLATEIVERTSPQAVCLTKQLLLEIDSLDIGEAMSHAATFNAIGRTSSDFRKGIICFLNKVRPNWTDSGETDPDTGHEK